MTVVARTTQHGIFAIDFFREKDTVAVERQESVLTLEELFEIESISYADCRTMVTVAPCDPVTVTYESDTRIILIVRVDHIRVAGIESYRLMLYLPVDTILAESCKDVHLHGTVIATEHSGITVTKGNDSTIEYTVGYRYLITVDDRVMAESPHDIPATFRTSFPW